jgi:hypothetical protein
MPDIDPENHAFLDENFVPVLGICLDTVGYGAKPFGAQHDVQVRLPAVMRRILDDIDLRFDDLPYGMSGDGMYVFLPPATDPTHALPGLLSAGATRLAADNARYRDRIRARMAIGFGLIRRGPNGLVGGLMIDLSRLVECQPIRQAVHDHPESDLVALVSCGLYDMMARSGCLPVGFPLSRVDVVMQAKKYDASAWLWIGPPSRVHAA